VSVDCEQLKLVSPSASRLEHLVTQMKWRLQEGHGEAIYQIGVEDSGMLAGLSNTDMKASLETLHTMADRLSQDTCIILYFPATLVVSVEQ